MASEGQRLRTDVITVPGIRVQSSHDGRHPIVRRAVSERVRGSRDVHGGGMGALTASSSSVFATSGAVKPLPPPSSAAHQCVVAAADASAVAICKEVG